jgi:FdhD protein
MKTVRTRVLRCDQHGRHESPDELASEEPLEMWAGGQVVGVTMRTPGHDSELFAGYLLTEGLAPFGAVPLMRQDHPNRINAALNVVSDRAQRFTTISSSCGICGKASIATVHQHFPPIETESSISQSVVDTWTDYMQSAQAGFARTGGVHAAAIFRCSGEPVVVREDIGRHNATDKAIGNALLRKMLPLNDHVLVVSGRASFEIVQKALAARISIIAAVSAPSSLAVQFAEESGQTLIGFLRPGRFNVYSHPHRIIEETAGSPS